MKQVLPFLFSGMLWAAPAPSSLSLLPASVNLSGPEARQQLLAEATVDGYNEDWTTIAVWKSSNPRVAAVDGAGIVRPVADGEATITAAAKGMTASAKVTVKGAAAPFTWSFRNHVIPVFTKAGCNQGACHGALAGKNGFKLTLRGYDPEVDYNTLTRESVGRRISLAEPGRSLMLLKPTFALPHGGGKRFGIDSLEYRILSEWIAAGTPPPAPKDPEVMSLEVFPKNAKLKPDAQQQLVVLARYSDNHVEDVTRWVKYSSNNEGVATVDDSGRVKMTGRGEAAVTLWYLSRVLYSRVVTPYDHQVPPEVYTQAPVENYIDGFVNAKLKSLNLAPSKQASDSTFIRRAFLDAAGILPNSEEVETFLKDSSPDKHRRLIDNLVEREEFVDYWAYKWSDLFLVSSRKLGSGSMWAFYKWIRESVKNNTPWDQMAREIFTGSGSNRRNGALNYFVLHKDPIDLAENTTQAFLGQRLTCARCHNHPLEKWTQKQYYQFANLFSRVGIKNGGEPGEVVVYGKASGDINHPRLLRPLAPAPLDGEPVALDSAEDRRVAFAEWLTSPENPYFARSIVNRVWGALMGRGLVDPVDDVRATNPASNEELFTALTKDFVTSGFDVKKLIRTIMSSAAYQRSSDSNETNQHDNIYYSKYILKRLPAEVIADAMSQVTGVPANYAGYPAGTRAMQLPDTRIASRFLTVFGRPERVICDASERSSDPSIAQALHVINGDSLNRKLSAPDGNISLFLKLGLSDARILEYLYLSAFSRYPTEAELETLGSALAKARLTTGTPEAIREARRQALEDMTWALLTSKEFVFNQ
ncbi:MAG TPA: DUF1549 domain-containing protein [Bryobacteraceae bacterium]|nr:DUF1549 domain-containing protein [Bryobacteraceae bacterium]